MLEDSFSFVVCVLTVGNAVLLVLIISLNVWSRWNEGNLKKKKDKIHILTIIGSGGHTMEMIKLLTGLGDVYSQRSYVLANTDEMGQRKVLEFERERPSGSFKIEKIPRSREVGQSYITSVWTTFVASFSSLRLLWNLRPDLVLCNGPGTGFPICVIAFVLNFLRVSEVQVVYVESICRVKSLSLTGLLLYKTRLVHYIVVHWPELLESFPRAKYIGRLI